MEQNSQGHWTCVLTVGIEHFHLLSFMDRDFFCQLSTSPQQASWRNQGLLPKTLLAASCIQILQDDAWLAFYILFLGHCIFWSCPVETEKPSCRSPLGRWWMAPCPPWRVRSPQRGWSIMPRCGRNWRSYLGRNPRNTLFFTLEFGWHMNIYIWTLLSHDVPPTCLWIHHSICQSYSYPMCPPSFVRKLIGDPSPSVRCWRTIQKSEPK